MHAPLSAEITRLYRLDGDADSQPLQLVSAAGLTRTLILEFRRTAGQSTPRHWDQLCQMANYLQDKLGLPAPAVSISGSSSYRLWLSLAQPVPVAQAHAFLQALCERCYPDLHADELNWLPQAGTGEGSAGGSEGSNDHHRCVECPPRLQSNGLWSAFIHPGMGAAFEEEAGLEMQPPAAAQAAFLERLRSISVEQWTQTCVTLLSQQPAATPEHCAPATPSAHALPASSVATSTPAGQTGNAGLLLRDATLDDIIRHLHERHIEPTFRHLLPASKDPVR